MEKPVGGEAEYNLLNTLVTDEAAVAARTVEIAAGNVWGLCRCRMAAIIERQASQRRWRGDWERRAVVLARFRRGARET
ncbi:MAG: hypothetical protein PHW60_10565 [Kiritimatiellae bacterium]|nr:hypothetical protein [Kiritimatiellia bacterium]